MGDKFKPAGFEDERIVLDFKHFGDGKNCQTSAMVRLMNHMGYEISEPMLVGISSGVGFIYWFMKMMTYPVIGGMNRADCRKFPGILGKAAVRLGGSFESILTKSVKKAHYFLKNTLRQNQPGLVCVDMAYLDHLLTGEDDHFGEHNFLVYGIDEVDDVAYISDRFHGTTTMALSQLQKARASEFPPFPAMNQMVRFSFPVELTPLEEIIPRAIRENIDALLNPPIQNAGVKGILKWSQELGRYPKIIPDPKNLVHALMMHYIYIETGGSGGAIFRQIFTDFLQEAGVLMRSDAILRAYSEFQEIVDLWHSIADGLLPDEYPALREIRKTQWETNRILETKGLSALEEVRWLSSKIPGLLQEAAESEVSAFSDFISPVREQLRVAHELETAALTKLANDL
ncbi:MAG: DUF4872 domain-containing protein [Candidatus Thorarchaeota archaeon]|nr:DUF4872 domain-containing protein [Candidatus Thorarchaeota archaeon]